MCAAMIVKVLPMGTLPLTEMTAGVVDEPSDELLATCDIVVQKPIKTETMEMVSQR